MDANLLPSFAFAVASAAVFALVARTVHRRPVSAEARAARNAFVTWWACLAGVEVVAAILLLPGVPRDVPLFLEATVALLLVLCAGLCGLQYYLVYLYTNSRRSLVPLMVGYGLLSLLLLALVFSNGPYHIEESAWGPQLQSATPPHLSLLSVLVTLLFIGPTIWAAAAYLSLYRKVSDPVQKRRILLVGMSILVWFVSSLPASLSPGLGASNAWQVATRVLALAAAGVIYYAYAGLKPAPPAPMPAPPMPPPYLAGDPLDPRRRVSKATRVWKATLACLRV